MLFKDLNDGDVFYDTWNECYWQKVGETTCSQLGYERDESDWEWHRKTTVEVHCSSEANFEFVRNAPFKDPRADSKCRYCKGTGKFVMFNVPSTCDCLAVF